MNTAQKIVIILGILCIAAVVALSFHAAFNPPSLGAVSSAGYFGPTGTTSAKVTVNVSSTQVVAKGWSQYARISNNGTSTVSCSLDGLTAASSSATSSLGLVLAPITGGVPTLSFGFGGDVPYIGAINCVANVSTTVGVVYN